MKRNIITIIATKNRTKLLAKAITSVKKQVLKPDMIIVTSDSDNMNYKADVEC